MPVIEQGNLYRDYLMQPARHMIMKSILSREDGSTAQDIVNDPTVTISYELIYQHLQALLHRGILMRTKHPVDTRRWVYYIGSESQDLQVLLRELFPEGFVDDDSTSQ